jgi:hypothetical protein
MRRQNAEQREQLVEDYKLLAFTGSTASPAWLTEEQAMKLLTAEPARNLDPAVKQLHAERIISRFSQLEAELVKAAELRAEEILDAHRRVRKAAKATGMSFAVERSGSPDVLGVYVYLPAGGSS